MSLIHIRPPACATVEKKPLRIRAVMNDPKFMAAPHQAAIPNTRFKR